MLPTPVAVLSTVSALLLVAGCGSQPEEAQGDIGRVAEVQSAFGPGFTVNTTAPTGIDPKLLAPQTLPNGVTFDPPDCGKLASESALPPGLKGNMAAVTAEGEGNRFIVIAVETSEAVAPPDPGADCGKVAFAGTGARGLVEVVEAPPIEGATTRGTHRFVQTAVNGALASGELYNYVANFGSNLVIVTANPLVEPGKPVTPTNTEKARELLTSAVAAVRGA